MTCGTRIRSSAAVSRWPAAQQRAVMRFPTGGRRPGAGPGLCGESCKALPASASTIGGASSFGGPRGPRTPRAPSTTTRGSHAAAPPSSSFGRHSRRPWPMRRFATRTLSNTRFARSALPSSTADPGKRAMAVGHALPRRFRPGGCFASRTGDRSPARVGPMSPALGLPP